jgi:N utilization substance protein A
MELAKGMAKSDFTLAFNEITEAHHLPREVVIDALKQALVSAYRRDSSVSPAQHVEAEVDPITNKYRILVEKEVLGEDEKVINPQTEIDFLEARAIDPNIQPGDMIMAPQEAKTTSFGRIAAQTAKQVILQKIREAERRSLFDEYKDREGDLVGGTIQSVSGQSVTLSLGGRAEAVMPHAQQIRGERYKPHDKIRTLILEVKESSRGPQIIVSRAHKNMLRRLLEYEVPEIYNGQVEVKSIAREPGHRSKVAVAATQPGVDPVGACVGMRGMRIQNIVKELNEEKIDVIEWSTDPSVFIAKALSPARVTGVYLEEDIDQGNTATVIVPDDQLSLAIGREGQNARLAAKLTGWRIDIKSVTEAAFSAQAALGEVPLSKLAQEQPDMVTEIARILEKKRNDRTVMPEEYHTLARFVQMAEQKLLEHRETARTKRRKALDKVKTGIPKRAFQMQLEELELARDIMAALKGHNINNVGDLMTRLEAEPDALRAVLDEADAEADAMDAIQSAIVSLVIEGQPTEEALETEMVQPVAEAVEAPMPVAAAELTPVIAPLVAAAAQAGEEEEAPPAFVDEVVEKEARKPKPEVVPQRIVRPPAPKIAQPETEEVDYESFSEAPDRDDSEPATGGKKTKKKGKQRQRELIFDENRGEVVAKRKRKRGAGWGDFEEEV